MNRNKLKTIYRSCLRLLPRKWAVKLNLALRCLIEDWELAVNIYPFSADFADLEDTEIRKRLAGLDENSIRCAENYVRRCRNLERLKGCPFSDGSKVLICSSALKDEIICPPEAPAELKAYQKKYGFNTGAEVLIYQHGLSFWKEKVSSYLQGKVFIDAGACIGELIPALLEYEPCRIYAFEPSENNVRRFQKEMAKRRITQEKVEIVPVALGSENGVISFADCGGAGQKITDNKGCETCKVMSLDDFCSQRSVSDLGLLKTDVEGMGLALCKGAINVIKKDRPVLALAAYHNKEELLGQYEYLSRELEKYHFELRDLPAGSSFEITLIGIPAEAVR